MSDISYSFNQIREIVYERNYSPFPYLNEWKANPYTFIKGRYFIEGAACLVYVLLRTEIKPNTVTIVYGLLGVVGGFLLAMPGDAAHLMAALIFFNKGMLDWADGILAKLKYKQTLTGHILDCYGALLGSLGMSIGLGFYVLDRTGYSFLNYVIPLVPFFYAASLTGFGKTVILDEVKSLSDAERGTQDLNEKVSELNPDSSSGDEIRSASRRFPRARIFFLSLLDDRARSVDFILLVIIIEMYNDLNISLLLFMIIAFKQLVIFIAAFYRVARGGWVESELNSAVEKRG